MRNIISMDAYCMKCKGKKEVKNAQETTTDRGLKMIKGQCCDCGTNVCKILGKSKI